MVEQTHELGVRLALGATPWETVRAAAAPGLVLASAGVVAGVLLARLGVLAMRHVIWGVPPGDPVTFLAVALGALLGVSLASLLPALRVSRLDPARTLRAE